MATGRERTKADSKRTKADSKRTKADSKRTKADGKRTKADGKRTKADGKRAKKGKREPATGKLAAREKIATVTRYSYGFCGSPDGHRERRAYINLFAGETFAGSIAFHDRKMPFPADSLEDDTIRMHLPSSMFNSVLEMLRAHEPVIFLFDRVGRAFLQVNQPQPVGEGV